MNQPESWGDYPEPHYDEDDTCECPDHTAARMRSPVGFIGTGIHRTLEKFLDQVSQDEA